MRVRSVRWGGARRAWTPRKHGESWRLARSRRTATAASAGATTPVGKPPGARPQTGGGVRLNGGSTGGNGGGSRGNGGGRGRGNVGALNGAGQAPSVPTLNASPKSSGKLTNVWFPNNAIPPVSKTPALVKTPAPARSPQSAQQQPKSTGFRSPGLNTVSNKTPVTTPPKKGSVNTQPKKAPARPPAPQSKSARQNTTATNAGLGTLNSPSVRMINAMLNNAGFPAQSKTYNTQENASKRTASVSRTPSAPISKTGGRRTPPRPARAATTPNGHVASLSFQGSPRSQGAQPQRHVHLPESLRNGAYRVYPIPDDGHCLFTAVAAGMTPKYTGNLNQLADAHEGGLVLREMVDKLVCLDEQRPPQELQAAINFISQPNFRPFLQSFDDYCTERDSYKRTGRVPFGNESSVIALSKLLERRIVVYRLTGRGLELNMDTAVLLPKALDPPILLQWKNVHYELLRLN